MTTMLTALSNSSSLLSGNIEFTIDCGHDVNTVVIWNMDVLGIVGEFLGVQPATRS